MTDYFYYHKKNNGQEKSYCIDEKKLVDDKENVLDKLAGDEFPTDYLDGTDFHGYETLEEFEAGESDKLSQAWVEALKDALNSGKNYPLWVLNHPTNSLGCKYEVCTQEEYEKRLDVMIEEYASGYGFYYYPCYYKEGEITADEARKAGMYALADEIETAERINNGGIIY